MSQEWRTGENMGATDAHEEDHVMSRTIIVTTRSMWYTLLLPYSMNRIIQEPSINMFSNVIITPVESLKYHRGGTAK
jgi:hypothetical protein